MKRKFLLPSWEKADRTAKDLRRRLGVKENLSRCTAERIEGRKRRGWRVVCTRLSDGKRATRFVQD